MICHKALKWALHDGTDLVALHLENQRELLLIIPGDTADKRHRKVATAIAGKVVAAEVVEGGIHQLAYALIVEVTMNEL